MSFQKSTYWGGTTPENISGPVIGDFFILLLYKYVHQSSMSVNHLFPYLHQVIVPAPFISSLSASVSSGHRAWILVSFYPHVSDRSKGITLSLLPKLRNHLLIILQQDLSQRTSSLPYHPLEQMI